MNWLETLARAYGFVALGFVLAGSANVVLLARARLANRPRDGWLNWAHIVGAVGGFTVSACGWPLLLVVKLSRAWQAPVGEPASPGADSDKESRK